MRKKYFAFISYKREDEEWAKWFQNELENYHLPSSLHDKTDIIKAIPEAFRPPKGFRPVFRDIDELKGGNLPKQIHDALANSLNLVVICSTKLSDDNNAKWVNKEITDFIETDKENVNHVFPFIVDGIPYSGNEQECYPKVLRELPKNQERIGGNINEGNDVGETNRERAFVKVLAGMLPNVDFDILWDRYNRDKMERERKEKEERDKLWRAQSRFVAEKAEELIRNGDSYLARCLSIRVLPNDIEKPDRPIVVEVERLLRKALERNNAILHGHTHSAMASVFGKDGSRIYSVALDGYLCVWDANNGNLISRQKKHSRGVTSICMSPDYSQFTTSSYDKTVLIWDANKYEIKGAPLVHPEPVLQAVYSYDGLYIISALANGYIWIWNNEGGFITSFKDNENIDFKEIKGLSINKENRIFASTWESLNYWDFDKGSVSFGGRICLPIGMPHAVVYSPNGKYMATSRNNKVFIWDGLSFDANSKTYKLLTEEPLSHKGDVHAIAFSPDSRHVAVGADNTLCIWDCGNNQNVNEWEATEIKYDAIIDHLSYQQQKKLLVVSFNNSNVKLVDLSLQEDVTFYRIHADALDFNPKDNSLAIVNEKQYLPELFQYQKQKNKKITVVPVLDHLKNLILNHEGDVMDFLQHRNKMDKYVPRNNNTVLFHDNGDYIYTLSDKDIKRWDILDIFRPKQQLFINLSNSACCNKSISRDGQRAVYAYKDGSMFLIDAQNGNVIRQLEESAMHTLYRSASFSNDSKYVATTSRNGDAKIWDAVTGDLCCNLPIQFVYWGNSIEFNRDNNMIISASQQYRVHLWKWEPGTNNAEALPSLIGHKDRVTHASFNLEGSLAVSASPNKIIVWDVQTGIAMKEIICHCEKKFVRFSPDSKNIFFSDGKQLFIIDYPSLKEIVEDTKHHFKGRELTREELKRYYLE